MATPFPGMDPYLEDRTIWPGFHHRLADEFADRLNARIGPKYYADVQVQTVFDQVSIGIPRAIYPDVSVFKASPPGPASETATAEAVISPAPVQRLAVAGQTKLHAVRIYVTETNELVTAVEILSPYNKRGEGLNEYRRKRSKLLSSPIHLVEIDLLRGGQRPGREVEEPPLEEADYILLVNRSREDDPRRISDMWPAALNEALPVLPIPLTAPDPDAPLDLNASIHSIYDRAGYAWRLTYQQPAPPPKLRPEMAAWLEQHLA